MSLQTLSASQASPEAPINENFTTVAPAALFGIRQPVTTGLTWGYNGGQFNGISVVDGTVTLTASTTNYVVANRATGVVSTATTTTNWNDTTNYLRLYTVVTSATAVTSSTDYRQGFGWTFAADITPNAQAIASYTYVAADKTKIVRRSFATAMSDTLPQAGTTFPNGWWVDVTNSGPGTLTITPTTSTIDGATSLVLTSGQGCKLVSDGTNYFTQKGAAAAGTGATVGAVNVFTKNQSVAPSALTSGATVSVDASLSNNFKLVLGINATLANPTNLTDGMALTFRIKQDATGSRTLSYGSMYKFPGGAAPVLSTAANAVDILSCYYDSTDNVMACNLLKAFA